METIFFPMPMTSAGLSCPSLARCAFWEQRGLGLLRWGFPDQAIDGHSPMRMFCLNGKLHEHLSSGEWREGSQEHFGYSYSLLNGGRETELPRVSQSHTGHPTCEWTNPMKIPIYGGWFWGILRYPYVGRPLLSDPENELDERKSRDPGALRLGNWKGLNCNDAHQQSLCLESITRIWMTSWYV